MKTVLVTGATSGLGLALTHFFCSQRYNVLVHGRNAIKLDLLSQELKRRYPSRTITIYQADYERLTEVKSMVKKIKLDNSHVDILINNVGINGRQKKGTTIDQFDMVLQVNFISHYILTSNLLALMRRDSKRSIIINISSSAQSPFDIKKIAKQENRYAMSKFMINVLTHFSSFFINSINCCIVAIHPGSVMPTNMTEGICPRDKIETGVKNIASLLEQDYGSLNGKFIYKNEKQKAIDETYLKESYDQIINYLGDIAYENCN